MAEFHPTDKEPRTPTARIIAWSLTVIGVALSLFQLYTAGIVAMTAMRHRSVFLTCILAMTFLTKPLYRGARKDKLNAAMIVDLILIAMAVFIGLYIFIDLQGIFERQGAWSPWDFRVGVALVLLVLARSAGGESLGDVGSEFLVALMTPAVAVAFALFLPSARVTNPNLPALYWLSGLTCDDTNFSTKAGAFAAAEREALAELPPDVAGGLAGNAA